jgi:hypothetical protein
MSAYKEGGTMTAVAFGYDSAGNRSSLAMGSAGTTSTVAYGYDAIGRLTSLGHDLAGTSYDQSLGFGYNPASQIKQNTRSNDAYAWTGHYNVNRAYTSNGLNQYTASGSVSLSYDANGNLSSDGSTSYVYDDENRLVSASGGHSASLAYDPLGRLWQVSSSSTGTTRFLYDGDRLITEYDGSGNPLRSYVYGPGVDEPLLWYEGSTSGREERGGEIGDCGAAAADALSRRKGEMRVMSKLSITLAWNESAEFIRRHFGPLFTIALAFLMVPSLVLQLAGPGEGQAPRPGLWMLLLPVVLVLAIAGNLALSTLALGREVVVGKAIAHGFRRTLPMLGATLLLGVAAFILLMVAVIASGVDLQHADPMVLAASGRFRALILVFFLIVLFFAVRLLLANPAAAAEPLGPIGIIRRSWTLTGRSFWKLLGLILLLLILFFVIGIVVRVALGSLVFLALGAPQAGNLSTVILLLLTGIVNAAITVCIVTLLARIYVQLAGEPPISGT